MELIIHFYYIFVSMVALFTFGYIYIRWSYSYWERHKIPFLAAKFPFGSIDPKVLFSQIQRECYERYKRYTPVVGIYIFLEPMLLITDLELVQNILIKDFRCFPHRENIYDEKHDPITANIFNLEYSKWKPLRLKFSPMFTSSKLKLAFPTIAATADELVECLTDAIQVDGEIEVGAWMGRYTTDVIGSSVLGFDCCSLRDSDMRLYRIGRKVFDQPKMTPYKTALVRAFASVVSIFGFRGHHKDVVDSFFDIVNKTVAHRIENNIHRNDFMQLLMEMKNELNDGKSLTIQEITAQAFTLFLAGFESSATTLKNCLYELSMEPQKHIQLRARNEVQSILTEHGGCLTYEALNEMTFIDQIVRGMASKCAINRKH